MTGYPPQPWELHGQLHCSTFLVPMSALAFDPPPGWRSVHIAGRLVVGAAWVRYEPGGVLSYSEVMATVLVRRGRRLAPCIVAIWVDSAESLAGGRAHWAIPKELASFTVSGESWAADGPDGPIAAAVVRPGRVLLRRLAVRFAVAQTRDSAALVSPVRAVGGVGLCAARWHADARGPLGFLAGRRPVASFTLHDFVMHFGRRGAGDAPPIGV